jgi:hypothetical protein
MRLAILVLALGTVHLVIAWTSYVSWLRRHLVFRKCGEPVCAVGAVRTQMVPFLNGVIEFFLTADGRLGCGAALAFGSHVFWRQKGLEKLPGACSPSDESGGAARAQIDAVAARERRLATVNLVVLPLLAAGGAWLIMANAIHINGVDMNAAITSGGITILSVWFLLAGQFVSSLLIAKGATMRAPASAPVA